MILHFLKGYEQLYHTYITNKSIALVGPAESIIGTNKGSIIDRFDLTIRLNKSLPLPEDLKNDIGTKTDIIYNSLNTSDFPGQNNLNPKLYKKYGVRYVCTSYPFTNIFKPDILDYIHRYRFELPLKVMNDVKYKNFENYLGTRPYTGTSAIMDLLSYPIKCLYITGLDFYKTKYYTNYRHISKEKLKYNRNSTIHQCEPQLDYLKVISLTDNRVILDTYLDTILYNDFYKVFNHLSKYNVDEIFHFGDEQFQKYFEMKISPCVYTKRNENIFQKIDNELTTNIPPLLVITDNKHYHKSNNEYCLFYTNDKNMLQFLNNHLERKKFIGNFFIMNGNSNISKPSIYLHSKFIQFLKNVLQRIGIHNCNVNIVILLAFVLYLPDKHYFSKNEILNYWNISSSEKLFLLFLIKKKVLHTIS